MLLVPLKNIVLSLKYCWSKVSDVKCNCIALFSIVALETELENLSSKFLSYHPKSLMICS